MGYSIVTQKAIVERPQLGSGDREVERLEAGMRDVMGSLFRGARNVTARKAERNAWIAGNRAK